MNTPINFHTKRFKVCFSLSILAHLVLGLIIFLSFNQNSETVSVHNKRDDSQKSGKIQHIKPYENKIDSPNEKSRSANVIIHHVKPGQSFWKIANKYNVEIESILRLNSLKSNHILKVGEKIKIPVR